MDRRVIASLAIATVLFTVTIALLGGGRLNQAEDGSQGCLSCHEQLSLLLAEEHPTVTLDTVGSCLVCHGTQGTAVAFEWVIHLNHYSAEGFQGDCLSCHLFEDSMFKLSGVDDKGIEATPEDVERMDPYYRSWATSEYEDQVHARAAVICTTCHGKPFPEPEAAVLLDQCLPCHGDYFGVLGELTQEIKPNPHEITHIGLLECTQCHGAHKESQNYCSSCHPSQ